MNEWEKIENETNRKVRERGMKEQPKTRKKKSIAIVFLRLLTVPSYFSCWFPVLSFFYSFFFLFVFLFFSFLLFFLIFLSFFLSFFFLRVRQRGGWVSASGAAGRARAGCRAAGAASAHATDAWRGKSRPARHPPSLRR